MSSVTNIRLRVLPRFPARISGTDGIEVVRDGQLPDLIIQSAYEQLAEISNIPNPNTTFFKVWNSATDEYTRIPYQAAFDNLGSAPGYATKPAAEVATISDAVHAVMLYGATLVGDGLGGLYIDNDNGSTDTFVSGDGRTWYRAADVGPDRIAFPELVKQVFGSFDVEADFVAARIPTAILYVTTTGYATVGDGGAHMKKRISTPSPAEAWHKQSADGAWWEIASEKIAPQMLAAVGNGVANDTTALTNAGNAAVALSKKLWLLSGSTYLFTQWVIPDNCEIEAIGSVLRSDGSLTVAGDITLTIGDSCIFDAMKLTTPGTETNTDILSVLTQVRGDYIEINADAQRAGGGIIIDPDHVVIGGIKTRKIDRPVHLWNTSTVTKKVGSRIGYVDCEDRVRAVRATFCDFTLGPIHAVGRSANASKSPGHNDILIIGCDEWEVGDLWSEDCGEHPFRIGGSDGIWARTTKFKMGNIYAIRSGGCPVKVNPTLKKTITGAVAVSSGSATVTGTGTAFLTELRKGDNVRINDTLEVRRVLNIASNTSLTLTTNAGATDASSTLDVMEAACNGEIGSVVGVDTGDITVVGNEELLRLSHVRGLKIGPCVAFRNDAVVSSQYLLQVNDVDDIEIASLGGDAVNSGFVSIDGTSDIDAGQFGGDVTNLRIGRLHGACAGNNAIGVNTTFNIGKVSIGLDNISGFLASLVRWDAGTLIDMFELRGRVTGPVAPAYITVPNSDNFLIDVAYNNTRSVGRASGSRPGAAILELMGMAFSAANQPGNGLVLNGARATAGSGNYGAGIEGTRLGSSRRGWAIAPRQGSADDKEVGVSVFVGDTNTTANEALIEALRINYDKGLFIPDPGATVIIAPATMPDWAGFYVDNVGLKFKFGNGTVLALGSK